MEKNEYPNWSDISFCVKLINSAYEGIDDYDKESDEFDKKAIVKSIKPGLYWVRIGNIETKTKAPVSVLRKFIDENL